MTSTETMTVKEIAYKGCTISHRERDGGVFSGYAVSYKTGDGVTHQVMSMTGSLMTFVKLSDAKKCITKYLAK